MDRTAVNHLYECDLLDRHGRRIGPVAELWLDGGRPVWAAVRTGSATTLVPIRGAQVRDRLLVVPVDKREVEDAPRVSDEPSEVELAEIHDHYGLTAPEWRRLVRHRRESVHPPAGHHGG